MTDVLHALLALTALIVPLFFAYLIVRRRARRHATRKPRYAAGRPAQPPPTEKS